MTLDPDYLAPRLPELQRMATPEALAFLQAATEAHPGDPRPLLLMAGLHASAEAYDLAEACYTAALHRAPGYAIARFQLGLLQFTGGRPAAGLATWGPLDALPGDDPLRLFTTAFARLTENRLPEALDLLRAGMARNTGNAPLNDDMQRLLDRLLQAGKALEPAPDKDPEDQGPPTRHFLLSRYKQVP